MNAAMQKGSFKSRIHDIPIRQKMMLVISLTTFLALFLSSVAFFAHDILSFKKSKVLDFQATAQILGANCTGALSFDDKKAAEEVLQTLALRPRIIFAALYDKNGGLFAAYRRKGEQAATPPAPAEDGYRFERRNFVNASPVFLNGQRIGTIFMKADLKEIEDRFWNHAGITGGIVLSSFLLSFIFSSLFQGVIIAPVVALSEIAKTISEEKDYSLRAEKYGKDELGNFTDTFNGMLAEIQKQNELLKKAHEKRFRDFAESASAAVISTDGEGKIIYCNKSTALIFGYRAEEISGQPLSRLMPGYFEHGRGIDFTKPFAKQNMLELSGLRKDGSLFPIEAAISTWEESGNVFFTAIVGDITKRKQAEEALRKSEELYRGLFDSIDEGFCIIEMIFDRTQKPVDYRFLQINPSFEIQSGLKNAQGKTMLELIPDHEKHWFEIYGEIAITGHPVRFENHSENLHRWFDIYAFRFGDPANRQVAVLFTDITQRRKYESDLKQKSIELERANKELESFSYSVSHDLRAPLRHIDGFVDLLKKRAGGVLDEKMTRYLNTISDSAKQMGCLIDDLLVFSRMGRSEMQHGRVEFSKLVREVLNEMKSETKGRSIEWRIGNLPEGKGDASMLRQVWTNLISNAVKYTGKIEKAVIEIDSTATNHETVFHVKDNGVGFDMQYVDKLFGVFQRLHRAEEFEGTGIGLANVQRIVARHGGKAWAESFPGGGAAFYFSLPK